MNSNDLFLSCNGKSYKFVLKELQKKSILNAEINIFSDKDVSVNKIKKFLNNSLLAKFNGYEVYYNNMENQKDFGIPKSKIKTNFKIKEG